jgi:CTP synthase
MKVIVVSGGVISGLGKGITTSSLGRLLKARGIPVTIVKIDPYLNVDAGTMNPYQHGEVFVLDDGTEADLDLGNYERFLGQSLVGTHNLTTGKIYRAVIEKERRGDYLGNTVQIIPHITGEIKRSIREVAQASGAEVVLVEVGGTVGDIESMPFLEALRELYYELGPGQMAFVHTTLVPVVGPVGEAKTKPTQHSVRELRAIGIRPTMIIARGPSPLSPEIKAKISLFCDVPPEAVISVPDQSVIYEVPLVLEAQGVGEHLCRQLGLGDREPDHVAWKAFLATHRREQGKIEVAVVGKYTELRDAYLSHIEAFHHCQGHLGCAIHLQWYDATWVAGEVLGVVPLEVDRATRRPSPGSSGPTGSWSPAASVPAGSKGRWSPSRSRVSARSPSSASATAFRWRRSSSHAMSSGSRLRTRPRSTPTQPSPSSACSRSRRPWRTWAPRCAWERSGCCSRKAPTSPGSTAAPRSGSATATATRSIPRTSSGSPPAA